MQRRRRRGGGKHGDDIATNSMDVWFDDNHGGSGHCVAKPDDIPLAKRH